MLEEIIKSGLDKLELTCTESALKELRIYYDMLEESNKVMNLTAISGEEDVARLHFLDSAALLKVFDPTGKRIIDIGTGAGFPGLPIKILKRDTELTLLDSLDKRVGFLRQVCEALHFGDVNCVHARAEEIPEGFRESFDVALSRAVARLNVLAELCLPYVKVGGVFVAMKGPECEEELAEAKAAISKLGGEYKEVYKYNIPHSDVTHSAIIIKKTQASPAGFPRRWAMIKKAPLK